MADEKKKKYLTKEEEMSFFMPAIACFTAAGVFAVFLFFLMLMDRILN